MNRQRQTAQSVREGGGNYSEGRLRKGSGNKGRRVEVEGGGVLTVAVLRVNRWCGEQAGVVGGHAEAAGEGGGRGR